MDLQQKSKITSFNLNYFKRIDVLLLTNEIEMIEYCKLILQKVSFSPALFEKELRKALTFINEEDRLKFIHWCKATFGAKKAIIHQYEMIIARRP